VDERQERRISIRFITTFQIAEIQAIENEFPVKIDIDARSNIQIEGQADSIVSAVDAVHSIFHKLEKQARNELEAEFISKEVITDFRFSIIIDLFSCGSVTSFHFLLSCI